MVELRSYLPSPMVKVVENVVKFFAETMARVLSLTDLKVILTELQDVCDKWYGIGLEMELPVDYLEDLDAEDFDASTCLRKVLVEWLKSKKGTWQSLVKVLNSDIVKGKALAEVLQKKYSTSSAGNVIL